MGIECVAVFSDPDSGSPHVREAGEAVRLPGASPADTYLRADLLVSAALATGADAVHPGYGFLSEDASFARACVEAGLTFVGPPAEVIEAMGSKLAAKAAMAAAGVPVLPTVEADQVDLASVAADLGWPVLVKASAGGGGRGMRVVERPEDLAAALQAASREAASAFGDGTVFLEPYVVDPRHVEVQILGDTHGNIVHLFERECSIQRRHQKIVEECPSPAVDEDSREHLCEAALTAARTIGYVGAGTVEFLLTGDARRGDGRIAFLEVNTRLQVEHPVTEAVTGLDLVRLQLLVAEGRPLPEEALHATMNGHAIEVRLYAEDPTKAWQPSAGKLHRFYVPGVEFATPTPGMPGVRVDTGVEDGSVVSTHYDPMLAKVISHAATRDEAARVLADALARSRIHGVTTNRDLLVATLRHPELVSGATDTGFLVRHDPAELGAPRTSQATEHLHALAAALSAQAERRRDAPVLAHLPSGWRNNPNDFQRVAYDTVSGRVDVAYRFDRTGRLAEAQVGSDEPAGVEIVSCEPGEVVVDVEGVRRRVEVNRVGEQSYVDSSGGSSVLMEVERFPAPGSKLAAGSLVAPLPGTVVKVAVSEGDTVSAGDLLLVIEAMKMEHEVSAPAEGTVSEIRTREGDQVEPGQLLAVLA